MLKWSQICISLVMWAWLWKTFGSAFALQVTTLCLNFGVRMLPRAYKCHKAALCSTYKLLMLHMHVSVYVFVLYKSFLLHTYIVIVVFFSFTTVEKQKHQTTINHYANNDESNYWYSVYICSWSTSISMSSFTLDTYSNKITLNIFLHM